MKPPFYFRYLIITLICGILGAAIVIQMVRINYSHTAQELISKSADYQGVEQLIYPPRGMIYDRSGNILATNKTAYELGIDLKFVVDPESIAFAAASLFEDLDYEEVYDLANAEKQENENRYFVLASYVSEDKILELEQLEENYKARRIEARSTKPSLQGLVWSSMQQRTYPEQSLAANVLGFYNYFSRETAQGVYGVEEAYNRLLTGKPEKVFMPNDPYLVEALPDIASGASLILTIDREIQSMLEETLSDAIEWSGAEGGTIIVADPETGDILGMASTPFFDPNKYWEYEETFPGPTPYNRAVGSAYEPGSVFKVITMAAALDSGVAQLDTTYTDSTGVYWVEDSWPIYNWDGGAWGEQDMTGCMKYSLNVCLAYIACDLLEEDLFYEYLQAFGFGKGTGIDLAGEANYPMRLPEDNEWVILDLATNAFGQGIAVTPIQMVTAISAIANDGKMMMPHIVKSVVDQGLQYDISPQLINTPITAETAEILTHMLAIALEEEASAALVDGYSLAGKTGTGEIATELGYTSSQTNTSFVGWGPADDPKFVVYVWLEKPSISKWGSEVAAPVFQDVVEKLVVLMKIPPDDVRLTLSSDLKGFLLVNLSDIIIALTDQKTAPLDVRISSAVIDSRQAVEGSLFIALPGERVDGHNYVQAAFDNGAQIALIDHKVDTKGRILDVRKDKFSSDQMKISLPLCLLVEDALSALQTLASYWRKQHPIRTIGITGSVGKTSTKELIASLLSQKYNVLKNPGNRNNEIGLPLTLLELEDAHETAVLEMGFYVPGEIRTLCDIAQPHVGVVTNIGTVHAERAGSQETIARGKAELVESLPPAPEGTAILNMDDPWVRSMAEKTQAQCFTYGIKKDADLTANEIKSLGLDGISCTLNYQDKTYSISSPLLGEFSAYTILRATAVALTEGLDWETIESTLATSRVDLRMHQYQLPNGALIIDDTYNASPASTTAALQLLSGLKGRRVAVLGDMLELGRYERSGHQAVGEAAARAADILILVGERSKITAQTAVNNGFIEEQLFWYSDSQKAAQPASDIIQDGDIVLIKGSNSMRMDRILDAMKGAKA